MTREQAEKVSECVVGIEACEAALSKEIDGVYVEQGGDRIMYPLPPRACTFVADALKVYIEQQQRFLESL